METENNGLLPAKGGDPSLQEIVRKKFSYLSKFSWVVTRGELNVRRTEPQAMTTELKRLPRGCSQLPLAGGSIKLSSVPF